MDQISKKMPLFSKALLQGWSNCWTTQLAVMTSNWRVGWLFGLNSPYDEAYLKQLPVVIAVIGSLARGDENHVKSLTGAGVIPFLLNSKPLCHSVMGKYYVSMNIIYILPLVFPDVCSSTNPQVVEFALRALQLLFQNEATRTDLLFADSRLVPRLLALMPLSVSNQISVTSIFTYSCKVK